LSFRFFFKAYFPRKAFYAAYVSMITDKQKPPRYSWVYVRQYCAKIDEAARNRMELIVPELAKRNGVTEKLKADTKWNGYGR
jgi:hypothetical protein